MSETLLKQVVFAAALLLGFLLALEVGYRVGRRSGSAESTRAETGAILGAMLGLLGLLLGFSFAGAAGRFMERQELITHEANAIGTAWLRADMLNEPHRAALKAELAAYVDHRLALSRALQHGLQAESLREIEDFHNRIWRIARDGVAENPMAAIVVLNPVNEVIDLHATRVAAGRKHLPALVMGLLVACSLLSLAVIGLAMASTGRRNATVTTVLALLIAAAFWTVLDLDRPRIGFIRVSDAALADLKLHEEPS